MSAIEGLDELKAQLKELAERLTQDAGPTAVKAGLDVLEAGILQRVPVRSGELRAGVSQTEPKVRGSRVGGTVKVASDHVAAVEFGTAERAANPFIRPTIEADGDRAVEAASASVTQAYERMT